MGELKTSQVQIEVLMRVPLPIFCWLNTNDGFEHVRALKHFNKN